MADQMYVRHQMLEYLGKIEPGTSLAIFTLASQLRQVTGFTTDVPELVKGIDREKEMGYFPMSNALTAEDLVGGGRPPGQIPPRELLHPVSCALFSQDRRAPG